MNTLIANNPAVSPVPFQAESRSKLLIFRRAKIWCSLLIGLVFVLGAALTWRKWPDPLVDFGNQLYIPWRLSLGDILYKDVMYLTGGPLSQYFHAALFKVFGVSLTVLIVSNLTIVGCLMMLIYRRFAASSNHLIAATICLGVLLVFAFNQYSTIGNFNYITPYCHEVWHGLVLSIVAISLLSIAIDSKRPWCDLAAGFCAGLVLMTKPDVFVAVALAFVSYFGLLGAKVSWRQAFRALGLWTLGSFLPLLAFVIYFRQFENWQTSFRSVFYAWVPLLESPVSQQPFYRWCLGLDAPAHHLRLMALHVFVVLGVIAVFGFWFRQKINTAARRVITIALIGILATLASGMDWVDCGRALPFLALGLGAVSVTQITSVNSKNLFPFLWGIFALGLLSKLGFYPRIWHYGFALAMPAFAGAIYLLLWLVPRSLAKYGVNPRALQISFGLLIAVGFLRLFVQSQHVYQTRTVQIATGGDRFMAFNAKTDPAGPAMKSALEWIQANTPATATLSVLPEGVMVNYLSRRATPARYLVWNPAELSAFGQENMTADFEKASPEYIMLIHRDASEYGAKYFGQEQKFGLELRQWIEKHYQPVCLIGNEPLKNSLFGIKILKRISGFELNTVIGPRNF